eukprot:gene60606-82910_t
MKKTFLPIFAAAVIAIGCNNATTTAPSSDTGSKGPPSTETAAATPKPQPDSATMMKNWQAYMTPSTLHQMMASWNGNWEGEVSIWHVPGAPPEIAKATTVNKMVMGGRYQVSNNIGTMMGMPFEGMSTLAYDNGKKVFISTWIDNLGTGMMVLEGPWDEASKTMTLKGKIVDPGYGDGTETPIKETFKIVDADHQLMEMFGN